MDSRATAGLLNFDMLRTAAETFCLHAGNIKFSTLWKRNKYTLNCSMYNFLPLYLYIYNVRYMHGGGGGGNNNNNNNNNNTEVG